MIFDYLKDYGSVEFSEEPLNYIDLLVFAGLSYFDFPQAKTKAHEETQGVGGESASAWEGVPLVDALEEAVYPFGKAYGPKERLFNNEKEQDAQLCAMVMKATRYAGARVIDFENDFEQGSHQFAALALMLNGSLVVVYRGTDESLSGWNEALQLSLDAPLKGQQLAAEFLQRQLEKTKAPVIVCGHSKGGNLAGYAAATCAADPQVAQRIASVVSFDGPGLPFAVRSTRGYQALVPVIIVFIPKSSIIGNIHEHPYGTVRYIEARGAFMEQHDIFNWETEGTRFVPCKQAPDGKAGSAALNFFVDHMNDDQKNRLFDAVFFGPRLKRRFAKN